MTPAELYAIVEQYSAFGDHHTGTDADRATTAWMAEQLRAIGATPKLLTYEFERWHGRADLTLSDGTPVPRLPVFYSADGQFETTDVTVIEVDRSVAGNATGLDVTIEAAPGSGAIVLALDGPDDLPVQANRAPGGGGSRPAVIIPGNWAERVRDGARLVFEGAVSPASSDVIWAELGPQDAPALVVTTPLTGWFPCAGERGTGIAAALALTQAMAQDFRVTFVGCSGHELDHLGLRAWLRTANPIPGGRAVHLGASVAATEAAPNGEATLAATRMCLSTVDNPSARNELQAIIRPATFTLVDLDPWVGEGANWRAAGAHVLSFLGSSDLFHTAADLPPVATTADALASATAAVIAATRHFVDHG